MINELTKFKWMRAQLDNFLTYLLKKKQSIQPKMIEMSFENKVQIWSFKSP